MSPSPSPPTTSATVYHDADSQALPSATLISTAKPLFAPDSSDDDGENEPVTDAPVPAGSGSGRQLTPDMVLSDDDDLVGSPFMPRSASVMSNAKGKGRALDADWSALFIGEFLVQAYTTASYGRWCSLHPLDPVSLTRETPPAPAPGRKVKDSLIVRFRNARTGQEVGRVANDDAEWMCRLMDLGTATFDGYAVDVRRDFRSGDTVVLSLKASLKRAAFTDANGQQATTTSQGESKAGAQKGKGKSFYEDAKESNKEKGMRERRNALAKLFDRCELYPLGEGRKKKARKLDDGDDDEEEHDLEQSRIDDIYKTTTRANTELEEAEPSDNFALSLRAYQKQALGWMINQESLTAQSREESTMHPLWKEYSFPAQPNDPHAQPPPFYYSETSGDLSLEFPRASKLFRGGILADEMGLGKTIMVASLILTATPDAVSAEEEAKGAETIDVLELDSSDDDKPPDNKKSKFFSAAGGGQQSKLSYSGNVVKTTVLRKSAAQRPRATLVVAPMTLLAQWVQELERSSKDDLYVLMYYGNGRTDLREEMAAGCDVVVTSYGTLASEWKKAGLDQDAKPDKADGKRKQRSSEGETIRKRGLFGIDWFRVVLDEAHSIKSRTTLNARAAYSLRASRRWALTGTPIVNRLEDLYSLVRFINYEPWSNFSYFRTYITAPFEKKDRKAMAAIQYIVERVLLRREKRMKDRDGNPIVALPTKHIADTRLKLSEEERAIYDLVFTNAKNAFKTLVDEGGVSRNVTAIFALLMRLRQAVLHPSLLLKRLAQNAIDLKKQGIESNTDEGKIQRLIESYCGSTLAQIKAASPAATEEASVLECVICFEPMECAVFLPECGHHACKDCLVDFFGQREEEGQEPCCPSCESGPYSVNTVDKMLTKAGAPPGADEQDYSVVSSSPKTTTSASMAGGDVLTIDDSSDEDDQPVRATPRKQSLRSRKPAVQLEDIDLSEDEALRVKRAEAKNADSDFEMGVIADSDDDRKNDSDSNNAAVAPAARAGGVLEDKFRSSTKLDALISSLLAAREADPRLKAVVFTQFTGFMDLVGRALNRDGFPNVRLDGTLSQTQRAKVVNEFTTTKRSCVLVASLKAGGVGLNLIAATHVYICDLWWNEAIENQAVDRIHRFGQTREVFVTRFLVEDTVDNKMAKLQVRKTAVVKGALAKGEAEGGRMGKKEIEENFRIIFGEEDE